MVHNQKVMHFGTVGLPVSQAVEQPPQYRHFFWINLHSREKGWRMEICPNGNGEESTIVLRNMTPGNESNKLANTYPWKSLLVGTALGIWCAAHVWLYEMVVSSGWPGGTDVPAELRASKIKASLPLSAVEFAVILFCLAFIAVILWSWVERKIYMDPKGRANTSLLWTLRNLVRIQVIGSVLFLFIFFYLEDLAILNHPMGLASMGFLIGIVLILPILALRPSVVASPRAKGWWKPKWPGFWPLVSVLLLEVGSILIDFGITNALPGFRRVTVTISLCMGPLFTLVTAGMVAVTISLCMGTFFTLVTAGQAAILIHRLGPVEALRCSRTLSWNQIGPFIALEARLIFVVMTVLPSLICLWIFGWMHLPVLTQWASSQGRFLDLWGRVLFTGVNFLSQYFWLLTLPTLNFGMWLLYGRLVWQVGDKTPLTRP